MQYNFKFCLIDSGDLFTTRSSESSTGFSIQFGHSSSYDVGFYTGNRQYSIRTFDPTFDQWTHLAVTFSHQNQYLKVKCI